MQSYTSQKATVFEVFREALYLYRNHRTHLSDTVRRVFSELHDLELLLEDRYSFTLRNKDVLDIGVGQFLPQLHYLSQRNRAVGIDFDVIAQGANPLDYLRMLSLNGPRRTVKTIGRKMLGIDGQYRSELKTQLNVQSLPSLNVIRMDACKMAFDDSSFDFIHSFSVLHSLPDPGAALGEIIRVLRPGGVAYASLQLYTSDSGSLDPRAFSDRREDVPLWSHLRAQFSDRTCPNAYVNKLKLQDWRDLFEKRMPGSQLLLTRSARPGLADDAKVLQARGELSCYSLEELVTHRVQLLWRKG